MQKRPEVLLIIGSSPLLHEWVAAGPHAYAEMIAVYPSVHAALPVLNAGLTPCRVLFEGNPKDPEVLAAAALLQLGGNGAPLAFIEFAACDSSAPQIVCAVESSRSGQRVLACQLSQARATDSQVLFDYQAPCQVTTRKGSN